MMDTSTRGESSGEWLATLIHKIPILLEGGISCFRVREIL